MRPEINLLTIVTIDGVRAKGFTPLSAFTSFQDFFTSSISFEGFGKAP